MRQKVEAWRIERDINNCDGDDGDDVAGAVDVVVDNDDSEVAVHTTTANSGSNKPVENQKDSNEGLVGWMTNEHNTTADTRTTTLATKRTDRRATWRATSVVDRAGKCEVDESLNKATTTPQRKAGRFVEKGMYTRYSNRDRPNM